MSDHPVGDRLPASVRVFLRTAATGIVLLFAAARARGNTYTVTNTSDAGAGSLRQALLDANANPGLDTITFAVTGAGCDGSGVCTIAPQSAFDWITSPVTIDGYTQTGATANTIASGALNAVLKIVLSGVDDPNRDTHPALDFEGGSGGSTVRGLVINSFHAGINVASANFVLKGCYIGTDASGMTAGDNSAGLIGAPGASALAVGGPQPADRNLISGNEGSHVSLVEVVGTATVEGNLLGTDVTGAANLPVLSPANSVAYSPIDILPGAGTILIRDNVVGPSWGAAVIIGNGTPSTVQTILQGNFIGTDVTGTVDFGNDMLGIEVDTTDVVVGGTGPGEGNVIAFNGGGVWVAENALRCTIRGNSIYSNGLEGPYSPLGIHLYNPNAPLDYASPLPNDPLDADTGANESQNFPILTSAVSSAPQGSTTITGLLNSTLNTVFDLDFYSNPDCLYWPASYVEGKIWLGSSQVTTDGSGNAAINVVLPVTLDPGARVAATATDPAGNTSEFSQRIVFHSWPGGSSGYAGAHLNGFHFLPGATVTFDGIPALNVSVDDDYTITFTSPVLTPGLLYDVTVTNTDGTAGTLPNGWLADFVDVPLGGDQFWGPIQTLVRNQVAAGIGGAMFGPTQPTRRKQMAVFLLKAKHGVCYVPPPCAGIFADVTCTPGSGFGDWIEELKAEGVTSGCGGGLYCPDNPVTREQMAPFLLKALEGGSYAPPACTTAFFTDVPCDPNFAPWIYELVRRSITVGCGGGNYCPLDAVSRGQMAAFLQHTFSLN